MLGNIECRRHQRSKSCALKQERHNQRQIYKLNVANTSKSYKLFGQVIERVHSFKYLGRMLHESNSDEHAVLLNLSRAKRRWGMIRNVLTKSRTEQNSMAYYYISIVLTVLLYGSETWTLTVSLVDILEAFHKSNIRGIANIKIIPLNDLNDNW